MKEYVNEPTLFNEKIFSQESQLPHDTYVDVKNALMDFSNNKRDSDIENAN